MKYIPTNQNLKDACYAGREKAMTEPTVEKYYGAPIGGSDFGWINTNRSVYIDPREINPAYVPDIVALLEQQIGLMNHMFGTEFHYEGLRTDLDWSSWNGNDFVAIRFDKTLSGYFATAAPNLDFDTGEWVGGTIKMYHRNFATYSNIRRLVFKVLNHEFMHILGTNHSNTTPSVAHHQLLSHKLNGLGYTANDLAVINLYRRGYKSSTELHDPLTINASAHITKIGKRSWLFVPAILVEGKWKQMILESGDGVNYSVQFDKFLEDHFFYNTDDFVFQDVAVYKEELGGLYLKSCYHVGGVDNYCLVEQDDGQYLLV